MNKKNQSSFDDIIVIWILLTIFIIIFRPHVLMALSMFAIIAMIVMVIVSSIIGFLSGKSKNTVRNAKLIRFNDAVSFIVFWLCEAVLMIVSIPDWNSDATEIAKHPIIYCKTARTSASWLDMFCAT